jgi:hypothetical protein
MSAKCQSVRDSLAAYLLGATIGDQVGDTWVVTLPIPTIDGRFVDVFIEPRLADYFLVHDGGKAANELILQGVKITDSVKDYFSEVAKRLGVSYADEMFQSGGKQGDLSQIILAVGTCSSLAMGQLVGHVAVATEEPTRGKFEQALRHWAKKRASVTSDVAVNGRRAKHQFDFVAAPKAGRHAPIAVSVISHGGNPLGAAQRFGFKAADLDSTPYEKWPRVAIEDRSELWSPEAKNIVRSCADVVIEIPSGSRIDAHLVAENMDRLLENRAS